MVTLSESTLRAWAAKHITGVDTAGFSSHALRLVYVRRERADREARSIDRLKARVVWGPGRHARLAIAGPRGVLP